MFDIVLDTCTLVHADTPNCDYQEQSIDLITRMFANDTLLTVDEGFSVVEAANTSYIGLEYIKHLPAGSLGYNLVIHMALSGRINFISNLPPNQIKNYINQKVRNKKDRMFLRVAYNSTEKVLVSHDFTDYQVRKRVTIKRDIDVNIDIARIINQNL